MTIDHASLANSANSLGSALSSLRNINASLEQTDENFRRVTTVLKTNQVFGIVTESEISEAKAELANETQPQIDALLQRAANEVSRLERKERTLSSKADLQQVRLQQATSASQSVARGDTPELIELMEQLRDLEQKKERLAYSLSRLNLKRRQMRMSMGFGL